MIPVIPTPRSMDLEITSRCDANCLYCYYKNNEGVAYADLPTERWLAFFEELGRATVMQVCFAGGEPFMRKDLFALIDGIVRNRMRYQILTNGRAVTADVARRLKETGRCFSVQVSLDGSTAEIHESMRGRGTFEPALAAIHRLVEASLPVTVRTTIHARNVEDLPAIARLLLDDIGLRSFSTNSISSLGTSAKYGDELFLTPRLRLRAMHVLADLDQRYPGRIVASAGPLAEWKMFHEMEAARRAGALIPSRGHLVGCGCIFERLAVRADGAYIPCVMLPQMVLGYIGRDALEGVWRNARELNVLRARTETSLDSFAECQDCDYVQYCTGSCAGNALSLFGDPNRPSPEACLRRFQAELAKERLSLWAAAEATAATTD